MLSGYLTDYEKLVQERNLVKKVLNKVNKKNYFFKTYPHFDYYLDADLVHKDVEKSKNLELLNSHKDIQFFYKNEFDNYFSEQQYLKLVLIFKYPTNFYKLPKSTHRKETYNLFKNRLFFLMLIVKIFIKILDYLSKPLNEIKND